MICLSCRSVAPGVVCDPCVRSMRDAPDRYVEPGILVRSGRSHEGAARNLVHRLKYDGIPQAALPLAESMLDRLGDATALVPTPRTVFRRHRFGIDPALTIADALARHTGLPVVRALGPAVWAPQHAGRRRSDRPSRRFRLVVAVPDGAVLIDDVVTTGMTISEAALTTGLGRAVTATSRALGPALGVVHPGRRTTTRIRVETNPGQGLKFSRQTSETPSD